MHVFTDGLVGAMPARSKFAADNSQIIDDITLMPIDPNFPTTISNIFSWMKIYNFGPKISLKLIPKGPINNIPASVHILAWRQSGDKPLSEPMIVSLLTHAPLGLNEIYPQQHKALPHDMCILWDVLYWGDVIAFYEAYQSWYQRIQVFADSDIAWKLYLGHMMM